MLLLLSCEGLFGLAEEGVGAVGGLRVALIGLLLQGLRLIGCEILQDLQENREEEDNQSVSVWFTGE